MKLKTLLIIAFVLFVSGLTSNAFAIAASAEVEYSVSGTAGNYTLDFTLSNTVDPSFGQELYFWGVNVGTISGTPSNWGTYPSWSVDGTTFNTVWYDSNFDAAIPSSASLSGFLVDLVSLPTDIKYFAYGYNSTLQYTLGDNVGGQTTGNPVWTGMAVQQGVGPAAVVPEPATVILLGSGLIGLIVYRKKRQV